jgi:predicted metal-dependent enzyme (double-stranded beta helix superfamily)
MTATGIYTLQAFTDDVRAIVARGLGDQKTQEALLEPLERVIQRQDVLADLEPSGNPSPDKGFNIYRDDNLTISAVIWQPNVGTPPHNHNGWAMEGVISGLERNRNFDRVDDGAVPWIAKLEEVAPSLVSTGQTTCLSLPPNDIHQVEVPGGKTLAIHIYGLDLAKQWRYQYDLESGEVKPFRSGMRQSPTDSNSQR